MNENLQLALRKVRGALASKDIASHLSHYLVQDGMVFATDNRLVAAAPFTMTGCFMVPGEEFDAVIANFDEDLTAEVKETSVIFKSRGMKATLRMLPIELATHATMPTGERLPAPKNFLAALRLVRPFVSDNAVHLWALGICLDKDRVYATNNVTVVAGDCPGLDGKRQLLPAWAADYILSRAEELETMILGDNSITVFWWDGSWMTCRLLDGIFPEVAAKLIVEMPVPSFPLTSDWKACYGKISGMTDSIIEVHADRIVGTTERGEIEVTVTNPVPKEGLSKWHKKFLDPVIQIAESWSPDVWPKPSPFTGAGIRGLIVGRT